MNAIPRVLLIDGSADTEAVVRAVLEPRGMRVARTRSHGAEMHSTDTAPDVVVLDLDEIATSTEDTWSETHQVLLGSTRVEVCQPHVRFLEKPFQFPELIQVLEDLLSASRAA
ncbi:MAG: hypothetical protein Q8K78_12740 [Planctomycetaceae bacterium]|nr:hypothetical protein [Planctomycetaceae bacterium]